MKYSLSIVVILMTLQASPVLTGQSQDLGNYISKSKRADNFRSENQLTQDTLFPDFIFEDCAETVFSYFNPAGWGFIAGTNSFLDLEKAQKFRTDQSSAFRIQEIGVFFAEKSVVGDGNVSVKIYKVNTQNGGPGELVATSRPLKVSDVALDESTLVATVFDFEEDPTITGNEFFASVDYTELYSSGDTLSMFMSDIDCGSGSDSWELFADDETWVAINDAELSWEINSNFFMLAIIDYEETTGTDQNKFELNWELFPNPAEEDLFIRYRLAESSQVTFQIYSSEGKLISSETNELLNPGEHIKEIDVSGFSPGVYFARWISEKGLSTAKFLVPVNN